MFTMQIYSIELDHVREDCAMCIVPMILFENLGKMQVLLLFFHFFHSRSPRPGVGVRTKNPTSISTMFYNNLSKPFGC